ncbi:hypothetical protein BDF14DRAFT_1761857 [Spinellus fusiger]|nr:hypothetical protein BDF14DRAFT_1761857 [Spinellus fusiger]
MMPTDISGFRHAFVTKVLVSVVGSCSILANGLEVRLGLPPEPALTHLELLRLVTSQWTFTGIGTFIIGTWLIYRMRVIERRFGSAKYMAFLAISIIACALLQTGSLLGSYYLGLKTISSGPYVLLFSILYQFYKHVPATQQSNKVGLELTDKSYIYAAAIELFFSQRMSSAVPCLLGVFLGVAYDANIGGLKEFRFPSWISAFVNHAYPSSSTRSRTTISGSPSISRINTLAPDASNIRQRRQPPLNQVIPEENIAAMMSMFPEAGRENILNALTRTHNDLNRAAELLLTT